MRWEERWRERRRRPDRCNTRDFHSIRSDRRSQAIRWKMLFLMLCSITTLVSKPPGSSLFHSIFSRLPVLLLLSVFILIFSSISIFSFHLCQPVCLRVCLFIFLSTCLPLCVHLSDSLSIRLPVFRFVCLFASLPVYLSVCLSVCFSVWVSECLSVCVSLSLFIYIHLFVSLSICLSLSLSLSLFLSLLHTRSILIYFYLNSLSSPYGHLFF